MDTIAKLKEDMKTHMRAKDMISLNVVRGILNEINIRKMKNIEIDEDEVIKALRSEVKKRKEAIENFEKAGRKDLVEKEQKELAVIESYLPAEMTDEQLSEKVKEALLSSADKSFGAVMKAAIAAVNGQADGKRISAAVKKILENG